MEQLPDDVVPLVLRHLRTRDVLACRFVCRRFAALALHPDVWRDKRLCVGSSNDCCCDCVRGVRVCEARAVLSMAPCLAELDVERPSCCQHHWPPYDTTTCAAAALTLDSAGLRPAYAALVIRNQAALSRLRRLTVVARGHEFAALLRTVASTPGLVRLTFLALPWTDGDLAQLMTADRGPLLLPAPRPSLRIFRTSLTPHVTRLLHFVLDAHADTLEEVDLGEDGVGDYGDSGERGETARLLGGARRLRKLSCPLLPGMGAAASPALRELWLTVDPDASLLEDGAEFLRRATLLQDVTLSYNEGEAEGEHLYRRDGGQLVRALGPSVETLVICLDTDPESRSLQPIRALSAALPSLPRLHRLALPCTTVTEELLRGLAIKPATAPALRILELSAEDCDLPCEHAMVHGLDALVELLKENPSLSVDMAMAYTCCDSDSLCSACQLSCADEETAACWNLVKRFR